MASPVCQIPVIALTSEVSRTRADYRALGFDDYVSKPFTIVGLLKAVCANGGLDPQMGFPAADHFEIARETAV
jgi:CheY-like chemotaxis protein